MTQDCYGNPTRTLVGTVYSYAEDICWQKTSSGCVGCQDWRPSPLC